MKPTLSFQALTVGGITDDDIVDLSDCFAGYSQAMAAMTSAGGNLVFHNLAGQTVTLDGVDASTLTAARLGFA